MKRLFLKFVTISAFAYSLAFIACSQSATKKTSRKAQTSLKTDGPTTAEVTIRRGSGGEATVRNTTVKIPANALPSDAILTIKRAEVDSLDDTAKVVLEAGAEAVEVAVIDAITGRLFSREEMTSPVEFSQMISTPGDPTLTKVPYVAPTHPEDGEVQTSAVISAEDLVIEKMNSAVTLVRAQIREPSFIATVISGGAEVSGLGKLAAKAGDEVIIEGANLHSRLSVEIEGEIIAVVATGATNGKFVMPDVRAGLVTVAVREGSTVVKSMGLVSDAGDGIPVVLMDASEICSDKQFRNAAGNVVQGTRNCSGPSACNADGDTDCVANSSFPAADLTGLANKIISGETVAGVPGAAAGVGSTPNAWDLRAGVSFGAVTGKLKTNCRNGIDSAVYNYDGAIGSIPASSGNPGGTDLNYWDTIDDYNNNGTLLSTYPAAGLLPVGMSWTSDNLCGGIDTAGTSADDNNVWQDVTPNGPCNDASDDCVFLDKISGLRWSEKRPNASWPNALSDCDSMTFGGSDAWRLPTQKELMDAYSHGIRSAGTPNWMTSPEMATNFWSASSVSNFTSNAWFVYLIDGLTHNSDKNAPNVVLCVR